MFVSQRINPCSSVILQHEETKLTVLDTNLLRDIDSSFPPSESDTFNQGWSISLIIYWRMKYRLPLQFSIVQSFSYHKMSISFRYHFFFHCHCSHHCPHHCPHHCFHHIHHTERRRRRMFKQCYCCYCVILDVSLQRFKVNMFPNESVYGIKTMHNSYSQGSCLYVCLYR